ncbi:hypothetical protein ACG1VR_10410 [Cedecea davisae]|uniref:hypothetical protein n=1 Tax=Cedecea davisae TaxID=158484 RepID=UPI00376F1560
MHSGNNELVKAGYDFAKAISNDTPIIEIAKIVSRLAAQLDVTTLALREKGHEVTAYEATVTNLEAQVQGLAAEMEKYRNAHPQPFGREMMKALDAYEAHQDDVPETGMLNAFFILRDSIRVDTETTDAALAQIRNDARAEGIYFTANRLLAAWDAGFIDSPAKEVVDVARMILSAADMLKDATKGDFSRKFADEIMAEMATELRKEQGK